MKNENDELLLNIEKLRKQKDNIALEKIFLENKEVLTALCYYNKICACWGYGSGAEPGLCYCGHWARDHH